MRKFSLFRKTNRNDRLKSPEGNIVLKPHTGNKCVPFVAPTDVQLDCDDKTMVQPDVLVVCDRSKITKERIVGAPDLVMEVISPSRVTVDIFIKVQKYKNAGVREYWLVFKQI